MIFIGGVLFGMFLLKVYQKEKVRETWKDKYYRVQQEIYESLKRN
jgi:hypothetical protein